jgi:hypothetical protein
LTAHKVLCAEPSPDVANALSTTLSLAAKGGSGGATGEGSLGYGTSEAILAMAGRTASVVALRDGLFRACEAYANGIIGRNAYGLILSQYGDVLVTLMLGENAATAAGAAAAGPSIKPDAPVIKDPPAAAPADPAKKDGAGPAATDPKTPDEMIASPGAVHLAVYHPQAKPVFTPVAAVKAKPAAVAKKPAEKAGPQKAEEPKAVDPAPAAPANPVAAIAQTYMSPAAAEGRAHAAAFVLCSMQADRRREAAEAGQQPPPSDYFLDTVCHALADKAAAAAH